MSKKKDYHVTRRSNGSWQVIREKGKRAISIKPTQGEATEVARNHARKQKVEVVIHRPNGRIRDKDSYGNDPCPKRDKKH